MVRRALPVLLLLPVLLAARPASAEPRHVRLASTLFGETVGTVRLTVDEHATTTTFTYRSDLLAVREKVRIRQRAFLESTVEKATGRLVKAVSRRCAGEEGGSATCSDGPVLRDRAELPGLAVEWWFARGGPTSGAARCVTVVDEESATAGEACAEVFAGERSWVVRGMRFGQPFEAVVRDGVLRRLDFPESGAGFAEASGEVTLSEADLYADPVPSSGDPEPSIARGELSVVVSADPALVASLAKVGDSVPWQSSEVRGESVASVRVVQPKVPRTAKSRAVLDHAAFLVVQARGRHVDCQAATAWFVAEARKRKWKVTPVTGVAWVAGRFAFHAWAIVEAGGVQVPVDPLLAQVPADAGHVQLVPAKDDAGALLVRGRGRLNVAVEPR